MTAALGIIFDSKKRS